MDPVSIENEKVFGQINIKRMAYDLQYDKTARSHVLTEIDQAIASDLLNINVPYAVTMDTYAIGDLTALHEIGHVFGGGHDDWSVQTMQYWPSTEPYSRGYVSSTGDWQTIMGAYSSNGCDFSQTVPNPTPMLRLQCRASSK